MNDVLITITRQTTQGVLSTFEGMRDGLIAEDVAAEHVDAVAATLTVAVFNRIGQIGDSAL
ncbi:hypothetical protein [Sphingomonas sp. 3-13AW]|uniref:hypothetical protein n=1 Tax=Sphingomonas sp. 3-13AW TaxID=3050450 RepID=UPI003BB6A08A